MTTQVFRAKTIEDAREAAKGALGDDAVILTTRQIPRTGLAGLFGQRDVEIAAAVVRDSAPPPPVYSRASLRPKNALFAASAYADEERSAPVDQLAALRAEVRGELRAMKVSLGRASASPAKNERDGLATELAAMRALVEELVPTDGSVVGGRRKDNVPALLKTSGIEGGAAKILARSLKAAAKENPEDAFRDALSDFVRVVPWSLAGDSRAVIVLVGPTGVGKTTTIAKMAAHALGEGRTVTLITCDTFRVGGVEQTQRYADLMEVPWAAAHDESELARAIAQATTDLILVDTSGRAPDAMAAEHLISDKMFLAICAEKKLAVHVHLCMTASVRANDAARIVKTFSAAVPGSLVITKLDETDMPSGLVHAVHASGLPLAITTAGQRVPEDISPATKGAVLDAFTRNVPGSSLARAPKAKSS
jgi:flagellar biosynthesis protein FlhF